MDALLVSLSFCSKEAQAIVYLCLINPSKLELSLLNLSLPLAKQ